MEWEARIRSIARMARGAKGKFIKRLYLMVGLAKMLYAADVWCPPPTDKPGTFTRASTHVTKMEREQRKIALQTTGALRTTPSDLGPPPPSRRTNTSTAANQKNLPELRATHCHPSYAPSSVQDCKQGSQEGPEETPVPSTPHTLTSSSTPQQNRNHRYAEKTTGMEAAL